LSTKSTHPKDTSVQRLSATRFSMVVVLTCTLLILIHLMASFFPDLRLWGIDQLHYFSLEARLLLSFFGLLILVPQVNRILAKALDRVFVSISERFKRVNKYLTCTALSLLSLIPFWLMRSKTPLLGDGYIRAHDIGIGRLIEITEPLDFYLHLLISRVFGWDGATTYMVLSCIAGASYIFLTLLICDVLGKDGKEKLFIFLIWFTMGANQLFFGYIESYTFMYTILCAYLLFSIRYLKQQGRFVLPCLFFLIACCFHLSALVVLPSLFYLAWIKPSASIRGEARRFKFSNIMGLTVVLSLLAIGFYLLKTYIPEASTDSFLIYPFGDGESFYSFFSLAHLLDFLNHQLLISPLIWVLWLVPLVFFRKESDFKENIVKFLLLTIIGSFAFALFIDPKLGYARDWDLFAFTGLGITFWGIYLTINICRKMKMVELSRLTLIIFVTASIFTLPWIWTNASEKKAIARFEDLLTLDEKRAPYGYETLASYFRDKDDQEKTVEFLKKAIAISPHPRYFGALGNAYQKLTRYHQAIEAYERSIQMEPNQKSIYAMYMNLGICLVEVGRYDEAISQLKKAISLKPDEAVLYYNLGRIMRRAEKYEEAVPYFEISLKLDPSNVYAYKILGITYAQIGKKEEAKRNLEKYLKSKPVDASQIEGILDSIDIDMKPIP